MGQIIRKSNFKIGENTKKAGGGISCYLKTDYKKGDIILVYSTNYKC